MVELAEKFLREHGFSQYRVRMHGSMARVEVLPEDLERFLDPKLRQDFTGHMKDLDSPTQLWTWTDTGPGA